MFKSKQLIAGLMLGVSISQCFTVQAKEEEISLSRVQGGYPLQVVDTVIETQPKASLAPVERNLVGVSTEKVDVKTFEEKEAIRKAEEEARRKAEEEARLAAEKAQREAEERAYLESQGINVPYYESGCNSSNYTYMSYTAVTNTSSPQYRLLRGSSCYTDSVSGIRMVDNRYCIAVGTYYAPCIGTKLDVVFEDGTVLKCIVGDFKSDRHTDSSHRYQAQDGSVIEFIIDRSTFEGVSQYPVHGLGIRKIVQVGD